MIIDLRKPNLRELNVGDGVYTSKGFHFYLLKKEDSKESWLDETSGLIWHDKEEGQYTHYEAVEKFKDSLPTVKEFKLAEKHGFREVLPNIEDSFWTSSMHSKITMEAYDFDGRDGVIYSASRDYAYNSVRCVGGRRLQ